MCILITVLDEFEFLLHPQRGFNFDAQFFANNALFSFLEPERAQGC